MGRKNGFPEAEGPKPNERKGPDGDAEHEDRGGRFHAHDE